MRDFEATYAAYGEFQDRMEQYWCLRWLLQEGVTRKRGGGRPRERGEIPRPAVVRPRTIAARLRPGDARSQVEVTGIDLIDSTVAAVYVARPERRHAGAETLA